MLAAFLDRYRDEAIGKVAGVSEADARRRRMPSLNHSGQCAQTSARGWKSAGSTRSWARAPGTISAHERRSELLLEQHETVDSLVAEYRAACAMSRSLAAGHALDEALPHHRMGQVLVRWIYVHLIEETARHAGQLDILREQIDAALAREHP